MLVSPVQLSGVTHIHIPALPLLHTDFAALFWRISLRPLETTLPNWVEGWKCLGIYIPPSHPSQSLSSDWGTGVWKPQPPCHRWGPLGGLTHTPEFPCRVSLELPLQDFACDHTLAPLPPLPPLLPPLPSQGGSTSLWSHGTRIHMSGAAPRESDLKLRDNYQPSTEQTQSWTTCPRSRKLSPESKSYN